MRSALFKIAFLSLSLLLLPWCILTSAFSARANRFFFALWARGTVRLLRRILNVRVAVRGLEHVPEGGALIAAKHQSVAETVLLFAVLPRLNPVLKKELLRLPGAPLFARRLGAVAIDRKAGTKALEYMCRESRARYAAGGQVVIFPEGTRRAVGAQPRYSRGVAVLYARLHAPCVPLALNTGVFWPANGPMRGNGLMIFEFLPPLPADLPGDEFMRVLQGRLEGVSARLALESGVHPVAVEA